ncbi:MAG: hypothetical protein L6Q71_04540, partial [Planctomycetes bacterium]|nr:hypothetical protein [Planctomycetota bacterium]
MALEQYTKRQKIVLVALVIVGAFMFTVTGAMMTSVESCSDDRGRGMLAGEFGTERIDRATFNNRRNVLMMFGRTAPQLPVFPAASPDEVLNRQLTNKQIPTGGANQRAPLTDVWPAFHDEQVWAYIALIERAKKAGFTPPPPAVAQEFYFGLFQDAPTSKEDREAHIENRNIDPEPFFAAVAEYLMIGEYIGSLQGAHEIGYDELLERMGQHYIQRKAVVYSLPASSFEAEAERQYELREREARLNTFCSSLAGAGNLVPRVSALDGLNNPNDAEKIELTQERTVAFDAIYADIEELASSYTPEPGEVEAFYMNTRGQNFRATAKDRERLEERLTFVRERTKSDTAGDVKLTANGLYDTWEAWESAKREELKTFLDMTEARDDVRRLLRRFRGEQMARYALFDIENSLKTLKDDKKEALDDEVETKRAWAQVPNGKRDLLEGLERDIDRLIERPLEDVRKLFNSASSDETDEAKRKRFERELKRAISRNGGNSFFNIAKDLRAKVAPENIERDIR